tara:strand:- start:3336 stop:8693 length:5358 start_codon:yes stop_codon:yes gene_type:complete
MASLFNTKISNTYVGLIKTIDNAVISSSLRELTDGSGNATGIHLNNAGDFKVTNILEFGSLKDTGENITITKFVDEADGIANNDNDTTIPTSAAIVDYVASRITLEDLDFSGTTGTGSVDLDSQVFAIVGTANEIETSAGSQQLQIGIVTNPTLSGNVTITGALNISQGQIINIGTDFDLYETATGAYIQYSSNPVIFNGNGDVIFRKKGSEEKTAVFTPQGSAKLYYNNNLKLETTTSGVTVTGVVTADGLDLGDDEKIRLGSGQDFEIYNDSSGNIIDSKVADLIIQNTHDDKDIILKSDDGSGGVTTYFKLDGSSSNLQYFKNSLNADNVKVMFGDGADLQLYHDATDSFITNAVGNLEIKNNQNSGDIIFRCDNGNGGLIDYFRLDGSEVITSFNKDIKLSDNVKANFGSSSDFEIYHDGTNSIIDNNTNDLIIRCDSDDIKILSEDDIVLRDNDDSTNFIHCINGGAVKLYHNGSERLDTTAGGVSVTGSISTNSGSGTAILGSHLDLGDNQKARFGASQDLEIYHDGSNSYIAEKGTGDLIIKSFANLFLKANFGGVNDETFISNTGNGGVGLYYNGVQKAETTSTGIDITGITDTDGITSSAEIDVNLASEGTYFEGGSGNIRRLTITTSTNTSAHALHTFNINSSNGKYKFDINGTEEFSIDSSNASLGGNLTIAGDLTVNGTTTTVNTETLAVEDPLISMAKNNSANSVDIGFYGRYNDGSNKYLGLFADASDSNNFKLFKGTGTEPTTTVDTSASGYVSASLTLDSLNSNNIYNGEYIYHSSNTNTNIRFLTDRMLLTSGGGAVVDLHSNGQLYFTGAATFYNNITLSGASSPKIRTTDTTNTVTNKLMSDDTTGFVGTETNHELSFLVNNQQVAKFDTNGKFGILSSGSPEGVFQVRQTNDTVSNILSNGDYGMILEGHDSGSVGDATGFMLSAKTVASSALRGVALLAELQDSGNGHDFIVATNTAGNTPIEHFRIKDNGSQTWNMSNSTIDLSGSTGGNITLANTTGEWQIRANGSTVNSMNINSTLITLNENTNVNGNLTVNGGNDNVIARIVSTDANSTIAFEDSSTTGDNVQIGASGDDLVGYAGGSQTLKSKTFDGSTASSNTFISSELSTISYGKTGWGKEDIIGRFSFHNTDASGIGARDAASIEARNEAGNGSSTTTFSGALVFNTSAENGNANEKMRLSSNGSLILRNFVTSLEEPTTGYLKEMFIANVDGVGTFASNGASNGLYGSFNFKTRKGDSSDPLNLLTMDNSLVQIHRPSQFDGDTTIKQSILEVQSAGNVQETNQIKIGTHPTLGYGSQISASSFYNSVLSTDLKFSTTNSSGTLTERLAIDSTGEVKIGKSIHLGNDSGVLTPAQYSMLIEAPSGNSTNINMYTHGSSVFNISSDGTTATVGWGSGADREVNIVNTGAGDISMGVGTGAPAEVFHTNKDSAGNVVGAYLTNSQANTGAESVSLAFGLNRSGGDFVRQCKAITFGAEQQWTGTPSTVDGYLAFKTIKNENNGEKMRISSSGDILVNTTSRNNGYNDQFKTLVVESTATDSASIIELVGTRGVGGNQNGMIHFINKNASAVETARIAGINGASSVNEGALQFMTRTAATSLSEKMKLTGDGYLRFASGTGGIQFGGDTAVGNALDDYEEGTFTPVIGDGTYSFQNLRGHYFKIGRMVHIHIGLRIDAATPGTATASISGLPYASETTGSYQEPHTRCGVAGNCVTANLSNNLGFFIVNGTAVLNARSAANNTDLPVASDDLWQGNTFIKFQMIYSTN